MESLLLGGFAMNRHGLRDGQFARIENLLPGRPGTAGRDSDRGNRLFVEAVIWKLRAGAPWRDLPERFGGWSHAHKRFSRRPKAAFGGVFSRPWRSIQATNTR
jgi:transposase